MNLKHVKWDQYILTSEPPLPHDVTFRVFSMEDESIFQEVSAHRLLLAAASEVFHAQFFGALASTQKVVAIRETTFKAFKVCFHLKGPLSFTLFLIQIILVLTALHLLGD